VVAGQDRHPVPAAHAHRQQAVGHGVAGVVEFGEGHRPLVVDEGRAVRGAARVERRDHPDLAPAADVAHHRDEVLRGLQAEGAGGDHLLQVVQFSRTAFGDLLGDGEGPAAEFRERHATTICDADNRAGTPAETARPILVRWQP